MHGLSLRKRRLGAWDLEVAASLYDYDQDETRTPTVAVPTAHAGGTGRIADQSGTGWSTLALRASWNGSHSGSGHFVELGLQDDRYRLRSSVYATTDWLEGAAGQRLSAFRGETRLTSLFAQDSWGFAHDWQATLGLRVEHWCAEDGAIADALRSFAGVPHRLEAVRELRGVRFVNDSKATNVASTEVAIRSFERGVHLIAGGSEKGSDFTPLAEPVNRRCEAVYLIGETAPRLHAALAGTGVAIDDAQDLERAFAHAVAAAQPGDVVLLSPACASYDQYRSYEERGEHFRGLVAQLT
jgi:hypothetical protein